jgi:murein L,D-transpeptidase YcbB/YkuD
MSIFFIVFKQSLMTGLAVPALSWLLAGSAAAQAPQALPEQLPVPHFVVGPGQIGLLEAGLQRYEDTLERGGWPPVAAGPTIRPGATDARIPALTERLRRTGDLSPVASSHADTVYDPVLEAAVRRFQHRHGLEADGLVGRRTLSALNVSADARVNQIKLNLERARSSGEPGDGLAVVINVPAYHATLLRDGIEIWATRVIVGKEETPTPELSGMITDVVLNPAWIIPAKIAAGEILPIVQQDPGYLARGGYVLYAPDDSVVDPADVAWPTLSPQHFPYRIMQGAGPANQLGEVKFVFPNADSVFLHDTSKKALFRDTYRAYSHGCIRMQNPLALTEAILKREGWTRAAIDEQLATGKTRSIALQSPVAIDVRYQTVLASRDGSLFFAEDIYGLDAFGADNPMTMAALAPECRPY